MNVTKINCHQQQINQKKRIKKKMATKMMMTTVTAIVIKMNL